MPITIDLKNGVGGVYFGYPGSQFYDVNGPVKAGSSGIEKSI